jgi:hypothetical protein
MVADKDHLCRILDEQERRAGFVRDPTATAQKARQLMLEDGIKEKDNAFSREIIAMREEYA